jgi:DNA-binding NarL/FixJ family response regulator
MPMSVAASSLADSPDGSLISVAIAHGQTLLRAGLRALLEREAGITVVAEAADGDGAVALARRVRPDVMLLDVRLPGLGCVETTQRILAESVAVMVLTATESDARVFASLRAGATGLLFEDRDPAALVQALRLLAGGGTRRACPYRRSQPVGKVHMLTPKVIEITRGSAHGKKAGQLKPVAGRRH